MWPHLLRIYGERSSVGRAPGCGPGGRGFESRRSPHFEYFPARWDRLDNLWYNKYVIETKRDMPVESIPDEESPKKDHSPELDDNDLRQDDTESEYILKERKRYAQIEKGNSIVLKCFPDAAVLLESHELGSRLKKLVLQKQELHFFERSFFEQYKKEGHLIMELAGKYHEKLGIEAMDILSDTEAIMNNYDFLKKALNESWDKLKKLMSREAFIYEYDEDAILKEITRADNLIMRIAVQLDLLQDAQLKFKKNIKISLRDEYPTLFIKEEERKNP